MSIKFKTKAGIFTLILIVATLVFIFGQSMLPTLESGKQSDKVSGALGSTAETLIGTGTAEKQEQVENGEIAAVIIGDEATLKRVYFYPQEGKLILSPENPHYAPLVYVKNELDAVKIIGKAVAFQSRIV